MTPTWTLIVSLVTSTTTTPAGQVPGWSSRAACEDAAVELMSKHAYQTPNVIALCEQAPISLTLPTPR